MITASVSWAVMAVIPEESIHFQSFGFLATVALLAFVIAAIWSRLSYRGARHRYVIDVLAYDYYLRASVNALGSSTESEEDK